MSDIKLFRLDAAGVSELDGEPVQLEKSLQTLIEKHLDAFLGVRFLASEYTTGKTHAGRIDTLGIDENGFPVIIEYKRHTDQNVITQGLYYLDWLLDHRAEFEALAKSAGGDDAVERIDWSGPRLLCIAGDFTKFDSHAVQQINRNIELIRYKRFGKDLLLFELVNAVVGTPESPGGTTQGAAGEKKWPTVEENLERADAALQELYGELRDYALGLGDDAQVRATKYYFAFKRIKNFLTVEVFHQKGKLTLFVKVDPDTVTIEEGFARDVRGIGHLGTGDLEITVSSREDLERAKPLIEKSYEAS